MRSGGLRRQVPALVALLPSPHTWQRPPPHPPLSCLTRGPCLSPPLGPVRYRQLPEERQQSDLKFRKTSSGTQLASGMSPAGRAAVLPRTALQEGLPRAARTGADREVARHFCSR